MGGEETFREGGSAEDGMWAAACEAAPCVVGDLPYPLTPPLPRWRACSRQPWGVSRPLCGGQARKDEDGGQTPVPAARHSLSDGQHRPPCKATPRRFWLALLRGQPTRRS